MQDKEREREKERQKGLDMSVEQFDVHINVSTGQLSFLSFFF